MKIVWKSTEVRKSRTCSGDGEWFDVAGQQVKPKLTGFDGNLNAYHSIW